MAAARRRGGHDPFDQFLPEDYTSVDGDLPSSSTRPAIAPDADIRRVPQLAATNRGDATFFSADSALDPDTQPNFFGTSAAAPHAAAIAALVLQANGGRRSLTPDAGRCSSAARSRTTSTSTTPRARARD